MKTKLKSSVSVLVLVTASACQTVLGDFTVEPPPPGGSTETLGTACEPDEYRCTNELLEVCAGDRSGFVVAETCASAAECNVNTRSCRLCAAGEYMCRDKVLERCDEAGAWIPDPTACETAELCSVAPNHMSGSCAPPMCDTPGEHRCDGAKLTRCTAGREGFEGVELCETPELCDIAYADELAASGARGACRPPACEPNAWSCEGAILRHCAFGRTAWLDVTTCESPDLCNVSAGACAVCEPDTIECNGAELRRCRVSGGWETLARCNAEALCDAEAGTCRSGECRTPGRLRCAGGGIPELQRCSEELAWEVVEVCVDDALCSVTAGRCLAPACDGEAVRCSGSRYERCRSDRTRWDVVETCGAEQICDPDAGCVPGPCADGELRCNDSSLERCVSGRFEEIERCDTAALCDAAGGCVPPMCTAPFECRGSTIIQRCRPEHDGFVDFLTCMDGETCDASPSLTTGRAECDVCTPNAYECDGMVLLRCSSDGQERVTVSTCPTSCAVTGGMPACG